MNWLIAMLPMWIIGAPFLYLVFDWVTTPKTSSSHADGRRIPVAG